MPGIATGETFSFAEGKLYLYASASGTTSGSGIGFARAATLRFVYGWVDFPTLNGGWQRLITGKRADLNIGQLYGDRTLFTLADSTAAVNAKFEGLVTGNAQTTKSAQYILYSGVVDDVEINQNNGDLFQASYAMHANEWSAFGA